MITFTAFTKPSDYSQIPMPLVEELTRGMEVDMRTVAKDVLENVDRAKAVVRKVEAAPIAPCGAYPNVYYMPSNGTGPVPDNDLCEPAAKASVHSAH